MAKTSSPPAPRRGLRRRLGLITRASSSSSSSDGDDDCDGAAQRSLSAERPRKGVTYARDGAVVCCRFCEILRSGDADFVYEDDAIAVFRPLAPVVESHVLVVPRCHIRNINQLTRDHAALLQRMRAVAELVLLAPSDGSASDSASDSASAIACKFAFHKPPFNSIDHVHMHAFRTGGSSRAGGYFGAIKYRTETWWCRSFEEVLGRVAAMTSSSSSSTPSSSSLSSSSSSSQQDQKLQPSPRTTNSPIHGSGNTMSEPWRLGDQRPRGLV